MSNGEKKEVKKEIKAIKTLSKRFKRSLKFNKRNRKRKQRRVDNGFRGYTNPVQFRKLGPDQAVSAVRQFEKLSKDRYLAALTHPDVAVQNQLSVKLFSDVPIPTAAIGFREQYQLSTSSAGTFLLSWRPDFLVTTGGLSNIGSATGYSKLTYNNSSSLTGSAGVAGNNFVAGAYVPDVALQRYRLVSALLRVTYNGSILNQSGTMNSCVTFDPFVAAISTSVLPLTAMSDTLVDRFGNFSLVRNGLWNQTQVVTQGDHGVECLYVPLDPDDYIFERDAYFHGNTRSGGGTLSPAAEGAPINYIVCGINLPASSACIMVDIYYNYEVIADPQAAPILRASIDTTFSSSEHRQIKESMQDMVARSGLTRPAKQWDLSTIMGNIAKFGIKYLPEVLSMF